MSIKIVVSADGPLILGGDLSQLKLTDSTGQPVDLTGQKKVELCRCGASQTKPWCDGSHETIGFQAHGPAAPLEA